MARSPFEAAAGREPTTPFAAMLDSADPTPDSRPERPDQIERGSTAVPSNSARSSAAKPMKTSDASRDDRAGRAPDNPVAQVATQGKKTDSATDSAAADQPDDAPENPQAGTANLDVKLGNPTPTIPPPHAAVGAWPPVAAAARAFAAEVVAAAHAKSRDGEQIADPETAGHCDATELTIDLATASDETEEANEGQGSDGQATGDEAAGSQTSDNQAAGSQAIDNQPAGPEAQTQADLQLLPSVEMPPPPASAVEPQLATDEPAEVLAAAASASEAPGDRPQKLELQAANATDTKTPRGGQAQQTDSHGDDLAGGDHEGDALAAGSRNETTGNGKPQAEGEAGSKQVALAGARLTAENLPAGSLHDHIDNAITAKTGAEANPNLSLLTPASQINVAAQAANATASAAASPSVTVPMSALAVEIVSQAHAGKHRFEIRLDPPELGRIDVRLDIDHEGRVSSRLVVDRSETLDLLRRNASQLERALQEAGLKMSDNALEFALRQQAFAQDETSAPSNANQPVVAEEPPALHQAIRHSYGRLMGLGGGLDIHV